MNNLYDKILEKYGYNEPIFTSELKKELNMNPNTYRQSIKRLADKGLLKKVENGIYFIPKQNSVLKNPVLSVDKIINKKYLIDIDNEHVVGYKTGTNFANSLGLTTQTASIPTIVTNNTASAKREVKFYNKLVVIKKPKTQITDRNYKVLQVLDLLSDFNRVSEKRLEDAKGRIINYLGDIKVNERELASYLENYPVTTKLKFYEAGIYNELTRR